MIGPRLANRYGWTDDYIKGLKLSVINLYLMAIDVFITEESERFLDYIMAPHVTEEIYSKIRGHYCVREEKEIFAVTGIKVDKERVSLKLMAVAYGMKA
jgi:thiamine transporter ThiT